MVNFVDQEVKFESRFIPNLQINWAVSYHMNDQNIILKQNLTENVYQNVGN